MGAKMFDIVRRRQYQNWRVMIDSARILDSPFDDSLICLSGAELELLRNITQYLHRQDTFVATYYNNHYLTPDLDAWDAIAAIVAGLEEKLMGCAEIETLIDQIKGYAAAIAFDAQLLRQMETRIDANDYDGETSGGGAHEYVTFATVPEGYILIVTGVEGHCTSQAFGPLTLEWYDGTAWRRFWRENTCLVNLPYSWQGEKTLKPGDAMRLDFGGTANGNTLRGVISAYLVEQA